jgi:hypothetical protein
MVAAPSTRSIAACEYFSGLERSVRNVQSVVSHRRSTGWSGKWSDARMRDRCSQIAAIDFLAESKYKRSKETIAWHVAMLLPYVISTSAGCTTTRCAR